MNFCECGCGQTTKTITRTDNKQNRVKGEYNKFINGHNRGIILKDKTFEEIYGIKKAKEIKSKISIKRVGKPGTNKGKKMPQLAKFGKDNPMYGKFGKDNPFYGKHHTKATRDKMSKDRSGENSNLYGIHKYGEDSPNYKGGITPLSKQIRNLDEYNQWRLKIFTRDNFACQKCGNDKSRNLQAHHDEESFAELLQEFLKEYDQFSPYEDQDTLIRLAMKWQPFWTAEGETLCKDCHKLTDNYGSKANVNCYNTRTCQSIKR